MWLFLLASLALFLNLIWKRYTKRLVPHPTEFDVYNLYVTWSSLFVVSEDHNEIRPSYMQILVMISLSQMSSGSVSEVEVKL